ncbi:MAG: 2-oxoglutarate dehydrogenase E1 component [Chitinophagales bacterium]|nr:2-oxoglutarate dehydrogenase E1 component [Chitinophagales bacterium]HAE14092.1 2-oxoglutarate dehydrogenase E1 component [Bacteroidota bacterium]MCB9019814.1 2-oxoglutarate dehydrogenase E1 component [Chitinophagales bacterium]MCB9021411.1 2-oxoglutarate dehydrogenase E1 component [Chitinophagales bacterium]MCB9031634.1 2-oxoglutarate dehydrogenase E1 component [Chitinophagales bacterium]
MDRFSYIANAEPAYIESLYRSYKQDPADVDAEWGKFFEGFDFAQESFGTNGQAALDADEFKVYNLILAYREKGHLIAKTNPIRPRKDRNAQLQLQQLGFSEKDLSRTFHAGKLIGMENATLADIITRLERVYCSSMGFEYDYIIDPEEKEWWRSRIEEGKDHIDFPDDKQRRILEKLNQTVVFEQFLDKKYIGQKRFSLEGGETTIPALDAIINKGAELGVEEFVIGMAHRGRLNVLANIMGKTYEHIFNEFEGNVSPDLTMGDGDVKYHLGFSSMVTTSGGHTVHLKLSPNPSHLEAVNPVMQGFVRAKADIMYEGNHQRILPVTIHGDAAVAGQGVVYEVLQMSNLSGYRVGGTIHFVINNQIGFTTDFDDARTSNYCTSYASTIQAPVIHVNGDDAEAVVYAVEMATAYRMQFQKDVFIDMLCYRKHGHNEGDDPKYTQPHLYKLIANHPNPREVYVQKLLQGHEIQQEMAKSLEKDFWDELQERLDYVKQHNLPYKYQEPEQAWRQLRKNVGPEDFQSSPKTAISKKTLDQVADGIFSVPEGFKILRKVQKLFDSSQNMLRNGQLDWALGELLAYGSLLAEGHDVRLSGQDVRRGTFSHRHSVIRDEESDELHNRLNAIQNRKGEFRIFNSLLSEFGVLGFEFGYSMASPDPLVIWEAQFGDFSNGAQTIIDQFISSSLSKWQRMSGLVMLLPHGYEGQGPEHSSARLERFLQLCAEYNIVVSNTTTPANFFHLLRRQLKWDFRRPLIHMSPKSLLRHPLVISDVKDITSGTFREVIGDDFADAKQVKRVLLCTGKVYYDLLQYQQEHKRNDVAIVRLEQLYPFPMTQLEETLKQYGHAPMVWVQEEPMNGGAWFFIHNILADRGITRISRKASASPASGFMKVHLKEQQCIVEEAFKL